MFNFYYKDLRYYIGMQIEILISYFNERSIICYQISLDREAMLAEMGVAIGVDGHTVGLFQPKRVITCSNSFFYFHLSCFIMLVLMHEIFKQC